MLVIPFMELPAAATVEAVLGLDAESFRPFYDDARARVGAHNVRSGAPPRTGPTIGLPLLTAAPRAFSSKLSVTDGDVVVEMANGHPGSIRHDGLVWLNQRLQPLTEATFQRRDAWQAM
jgi:hypothetical protein